MKKATEDCPSTISGHEKHKDKTKKEYDEQSALLVRFQCQIVIEEITIKFKNLVLEGVIQD